MTLRVQKERTLRKTAGDLENEPNSSAGLRFRLPGKNEPQWLFKRKNHFEETLIFDLDEMNVFEINVCGQRQVEIHRGKACDTQQTRFCKQGSPNLMQSLSKPTDSLDEKPLECI